MRLIKMFGLAAIAAVAATASVGPTSASAVFPTALCDEHVDLECPEGSETALVHMELEWGTVGRLLSSLVTVLCLEVLATAQPLGLGNPQSVHVTDLLFVGCGTGSAHNNCTVEVEVKPLFNLLKSGLDTGSITATNGTSRLRCPNLGIDCKIHTAGVLFGVGAQHFTANDTGITELGGKFFCPDNGKLDGLLETLENTYILQ